MCGVKVNGFVYLHLLDVRVAYASRHEYDLGKPPNKGQPPNNRQESMHKLVFIQRFHHIVLL